MYSDIYEEMRKRNKKIILEDGIKVDSKLLLTNDTRKGLGLFSFFKDHSSNNLERVRNEMIEEFPDQVVYKTNLSSLSDTTHFGLFHSTFMQFIGVNENLPEEFLQGVSLYIDILKRVLFEMGPYEINFKGLIAIPSGILVSGYPSLDINCYRNEVRNLISDNNLPFNEPYKSDIVHATLLRLSNVLKPSSLLDFTNKYETMDFGKLFVNKMYLGFGSWAMREHETELLYEFDLIEKIVKKL